MKQDKICKGYVIPYNAFCYFAISLIFMVCFVSCAIFFASYTIIAVISVALALLCCLIPLVGLAFDKTAMRYSITDAYVQSRNLFCTRCRLEDSEIRQIELQWAREIWKDFVTQDAIYLVCSDKYYAQVKYIALKYHRKNQVVVHITRKNFPAVQEYLQRMGIFEHAVNYDALVQILQCAPQVYRRTDGEWKQK